MSYEAALKERYKEAKRRLYGPPPRLRLVSAPEPAAEPPPLPKPVVQHAPTPLPPPPDSLLLALAVPARPIGPLSWAPKPGDRLPKFILVRRIIAACAADAGITIPEMIGASRKRPHVLARQRAARLIRRVTEWSYPHIGSVLGGRDHTTIIHAMRRNEIAEEDYRLLDRIGAVLDDIEVIE